MIRSNRRSVFTLLAVLGVLMVPLVGASGARAQAFPLALELDGTRVPPGSEIELVLRTTEARPLQALDLAFEVRDRRGVPAVAFAALTSHALLGGGSNAAIAASFDGGGQRLTAELSDVDGLLNDELGPLAVFRFSLHPSVELDDRFEIWVDPDVVAVDAAGDPVVTTVGRADLRIIDPDPTQGLGALGGEAYPGGQVVIGAVTERPFAIGSGTIEITYDATLFAPGYTIVFDEAYGAATIDAVSEPEAGHLLVTFTAPGGDLNLGVHGAFFQVVLQALPTVPIGTSTLVDVGAATELFDGAGDPIALEIDGETVDFIDPEIVAVAAFEGGDLAEWWNVTQ